MEGWSTAGDRWRRERLDGGIDGTGNDGELGSGWRRTGGEIKGWMERLLDEK